MQLQEFIAKATKQLHEAGIGTARLDVLVLLEDVLGMDRARLLAHPDMTIPPPSLDSLNKYIIQRTTHLPLAYIRGRVAFYGRDFAVNTHVLVPRPETETMIDLLLALPLSEHPTIVDVGTGSGCIGITAALALPQAVVTLRDVDPSALEVAKANANRLQAAVSTEQGNLLQDLQSTDVLLANLPYVPEAYPINQAATFEPALALFAGADGLDLYRTFWEQAAALNPKPAYVLTESLPEQHKKVASLAHEAGYRLETREGLIQVFTDR